MLELLQKALGGHCKKLWAMLELLRTKAGFKDRAAVKREAAATAAAAAKAAAAKKEAAAKDGEGGEGGGEEAEAVVEATVPAEEVGGVAGSTGEEWAAFQSALTLLQAAAQLTSFLHALDLAVRLAVQQSSQRLLQPQALISSRATKEDMVLDSARKRVDKSAETAQAIKRLGITAADAHRLILPTAAHAFAGWAGGVQKLGFDLVLLRVRASLNKLPTMSEWAAAAEGGGEDDAFSLASLGSSGAPQAYISELGEHLLEFLQQLDSFSADGGAGLAAPDGGAQSVSPVLHAELHRLAHAEWGEFGEVLALNERELRTLLHYTQQEQGGADAAEAGKDEDGEDTMLAQFASEWLDAVSHAIVGLYMTSVLRIEHLSATGVKQLAADIGYLVNVLSTLGLTAEQLLLDMHAMCEMDADALKIEIQNEGLQQGSSIASKLRARIAAARGIGV
jgi:hypothetical protein